MPGDEGKINWNYTGRTDFLLGTGATRAEQALGWLASFVGASLYVYLYVEKAFPWAWWQYLLAGVLAFDVIGGVAANCMNSCKRFYHSATKPDEPRYTWVVKNHVVFSVLHVHSLLVAILYGSDQYFYGIFWYAYLIGSTLIVIRTPLYLKRPVAFFIIAIALLLNIYFVLPVSGFEWLTPALLIKIVYGHLVQEEPYRPVAEKAIQKSTAG